MAKQDWITKMLETLNTIPKHTKDAYVRKLIKRHTSKTEEREVEMNKQHSKRKSIICPKCSSVIINKSISD